MGLGGPPVRMHDAGPDLYALRAARRLAGELAARDGAPPQIRRSVAALDDDTLVASLAGAAALAYRHGAGGLAHPAALRRLATWFALSPTWDIHQLPRWTHPPAGDRTLPGEPEVLSVVGTPEALRALRTARARAFSLLRRTGITTHADLLDHAVAGAAATTHAGARLRLATCDPAEALELLGVAGDGD
jgi:hypothetical protein